MRGIFLTEDELRALDSLPFAAVVLYVMGLRPRMDAHTGLVGQVARISWQALSETLEVPARRGMAGVDMSLEATRRACAWLIRAGLVRNRTSPAVGTLLFFLPIAHAHSLARPKADRKSDRKADRGLQREQRPKADRKADRKADTHLRELKASESNGGGGSSRAAAAAAEVIWPKSFTASQRARAQLILADCDQAQDCADELAGRMEQGDVRNPLALLAAIRDQADRGELHGGRAERVRRRREAANVGQGQPPASNATAARLVGREEGAARVAALKSQLKRRVPT